MHTFESNARLKLAKNQVNTKQYPETENCENSSHFSSTFLFKKFECILKNKQKNNFVWMYSSRDHAMSHNENEDKNKKQIIQILDK